MKSTEVTYYVCREGQTEEEPFSWEAIEEMCRSGEFTSETRIFLPEKNFWTRVADTELKAVLKTEDTRPAANQLGSADADRESLRAEYGDVLSALRDQPEEPDLYVEAGRLAAEMGDRDAARKHFQLALDLKPFNPRVAREVQQRFSKSECRKFRFLHRDPPSWEDPIEVVSYPSARGITYLAVPAAVLFVLLLVPFGKYAAWPLAYLWCLQTARQTAAGSRRPALWQTALANPAREIVLPLLAGVVVFGECVLVAYGVGRLYTMFSQGEAAAIQAVAGSPVLSVTLSLVAIAYLPAVFVRISHAAGIIVDLLAPWIVITAMRRMQQEYIISALLVLVVAFLVGALKFAFGGIPVLGHVVLAAALAYAIPVVGFILGRLAGRMEHVL